MKKSALFIWVLVLCLGTTLHTEKITASSPDESFHQGFVKGLQGTYNNNPQQLLRDMFSGKQIFQVPNFAYLFLQNARYATQDSTITMDMLKNECRIGDMPAGFIKNGATSTYEISRWTPDFSDIQWCTRNAYSGERGVWFRGVCIMSVYCGNLMRPRFEFDKQLPIAGEEPSDPYVISELPKKQEFKSQYANYPGGIHITVNGSPATAIANNSYTAPTAGIGESNLTFADDAPQRRRRRSYDDGGQQGGEMIVRTPARAVDWVNAGANLANAVFSGVNTFRGIRIEGNRQQPYYNQNYNYSPHYYNNGWGGNNNTPWHGGTDLQSQGQLPNNLYNNGTGQIVPPRYSNNAYTSGSYGYQGQPGPASNGGYYGMYNRGGY